MKFDARWVLPLAVVLIQAMTVNAQWVQMNGPSGGYVAKLIVANSSLYAGTLSGIYVSRDSGATWSVASTSLQHSSIIGFHAIGATLFAAVEDSGLLRSVDNGATWSPILTDINIRSGIAMLAIGTELLVGARNIVYRTTNNGEDWDSVVLNPNIYGVTGLASSNGKLFASTQWGGVHVSTDNGFTWTASNQGLTNLEAMHITKSGTNIIVGTQRGGVFTSIDNGATWVVSSLQSVGISSLRANGSTVFAGTYLYGAYRSSDGGFTWSEVIGDYRTETQHDFAFAGDDVYMCTDGGVYRSTYNGNFFKDVSQGLYNSSVVSLVRSGEYLYASTDRSGVARSADDGETWVDADIGLPAGSTSSFATANGKLFLGTMKGIYVSTDDGARWRKESALTGTGLSSLAVIDDSIYALTSNGLFVSSRDSISWKRLGLIASWAPLIRSGNTLVAGSLGFVKLSYDRGLTWHDGGSGLTGSHVTSLAVMGSKLLAGTTPGVWTSTSNGVTWQASSNSLLAVVNSLLVHGASLLASTYEQGVYLSTDSGRTWKAINEGLLPRTVNTLFIDGAMLYAGTSNGGVWRRPLTDLVTSVDENPKAVQQCEPTTESAIRIYSITGELVATGNDMESMGLPRGLYFIHRTCREHTHTTSLRLLE